MAVDTASAEPPEELSPLIEALERARLRASAATALREALESEVWQLFFKLLRLWTIKLSMEREPV